MKDNYYVFKNGSLERDQDTLLFTNEDGEKTRIPVQKVECLYVHGQLDFNTRLASFLNQKGIELHLFGWNGRYAGSIVPKKGQVSGETVVEQVNSYQSASDRLRLAKEFVDGSIENMQRNLKYYARNRNSDYSKELSALDSAQQQLLKVNSIDEVMGREAEARQAYYSVFRKEVDVFEFERREYNPPSNELNAVLSYLNSLLYSNTLSAIRKTALDPSVSFLHEPGERRYSLALDIADVFKPLLVTRPLVSLCNTGQLDSSSFRDDIDGLLLKENSRKQVAKEFEETMQRTTHHPDLNRHVSYQYLLQLEAYKLKKHVLGGTKYNAFNKWW